MSALVVAIHRTENYLDTSPADLAAAVEEVAGMEEMRVRQAFAEAVAAGAPMAELAGLYRHSQLVEDLKTGLQEGDLTAVQNYVAIAQVVEEGGGPISAETAAILLAVVANHSLSVVQVAAREAFEEAPEEVTAADVEAALASEGLTWNDEVGRWDAAA